MSECLDFICRKGDCESLCFVAAMVRLVSVHLLSQSNCSMKCLHLQIGCILDFSLAWMVSSEIPS